MKNTYVVKVGDLVIADFLDDIFVMALATCVSFVSVNYTKQKVLATHFLRPRSLEDIGTQNNLAYVEPGISIAIQQFEKETHTPIVNCENYLIGGISKHYTQFAGEIGDLNVAHARKILENKQIRYHEFVGSKHPKSISIRNGIISVKTTE